MDFTLYRPHKLESPVRQIIYGPDVHSTDLEASNLLYQAYWNTSINVHTGKQIHSGADEIHKKQTN